MLLFSITVILQRDIHIVIIILNDLDKYIQGSITVIHRM